MSDSKGIIGSMFVKIGALLLVGIIAAIVVTLTVNPGPGNISLASAAWGLAIWLAVLTIAFIGLVWQMAIHQHD